MSPSTSTMADTPVPTFRGLGVRTVINCRGTYTILSGSRVLDQVARAMVEATNHYVHLDELMDRVGVRLAELTGAEWGYITAGCASALTQVTAACIAGADPEKMARLPDTTGMPDEVLIQQSDRNQYDRAMRAAGARMIKVVTEADLRAALSERTAMIAINGDALVPHTIPVGRMIEVGHTQGIPCLVDAAAQRPDLPNRYLQMGADAVVYSGGKCLRGPQASGLVLGKKDLLKAAFLNGAPHHGVGRTAKAGKEEIMGLLAAVEAWLLGRDHQAEWRMWEGYLETIRKAIADVPSVTTHVQQPGIFNVAPTLLISWDAELLGLTPETVHRALWDGDPRVTLHLRPNGIEIMPYMMEAGDDELVAGRLRELLTCKPEQQPEDPESASPAQLAGTWEIRLAYVRGASRHSMALQQEGSRIAGNYRPQYAWSRVEGQVTGDRVAFQTTLGYQSNSTEYRFCGTVDLDTMCGRVTLGEYGEAEWSARRIE